MSPRSDRILVAVADCLTKCAGVPSRQLAWDIFLNLMTRDPTGINGPEIPPNGATNGPGVDHRFLSPAAPLAAFVGIRLTL
jgi:hypothetical protein